MTSFSFIHFTRIAFLLIHICSAAATSAEDLCDSSTYGQPNYSDCIDLLYGTPGTRSAGIFHLDAHEHGFFLPYFGTGGQFTINQWRHRVELPEVWHNSTPNLAIPVFEMDDIQLTCRYVGGCKIALLVQSSPTGGFTTDSGTWDQIATRMRGLLNFCLLSKKKTQQYSGGVGEAGSHGRLNVVIYGLGSPFDRAITGIGPGGSVGVELNRTVAEWSASGRILNLSQV